MEEKMNYYIGHPKAIRATFRKEKIYGSGKRTIKKAFDIGFGQRMTIRWCSPVRR